MVTIALLAMTASGNLTFPDGGLPLARPFGYAAVGKTQLVGGLDGLFIGAPGKWTHADTASVKQIEIDQAGSAWIRLGDGAVDKVDVKSDRHYHDVLFGASRRPWVSVIGFAGSTVLFGGHGGWMEKSGDKDLTDFFPPELKGQVVTAALGTGADRWIGTQASGLWRFGKIKVERYGLAAGLDDPWVTGLCHDGKKLWIGLADDGIYSLSAGKLEKQNVPFKRVRALTLWQKSLVAATDIGVYIQEKANWRRLTQKESYAAIPGPDLAILEPDAIRFIER